MEAEDSAGRSRSDASSGDPKEHLTLVPQRGAAGRSSSSALALATLGTSDVVVLADEDDQRLRIIRTADGSSVAAAPLKGTPGHVVVDTDGIAWVAIRDADVVQSFRLVCPVARETKDPEAGTNPCTLQELGEVATPAEPLALALAGGSLFVACAWGRELVRIDLTNRTIVARAGLAREPRALLVTKDEDALFIAHAAGSRVSEARIDVGGSLGRVGERSASTAIAVREHRLDWRDHAYEGHTAVNDEPRFASQGFALARGADGHVHAPMVLAYPGDPVPSRGYGSPREDTFFPHETMVVSLHDPPDGSPARLRSRASTFAAEENRISAGRVPWPSDLPPCLLPRAAVSAPWRSSILVACMGIDQIVEIDANEKPLVESMGDRWNVPGGPVAIAVDERKQEIFIWSMFDRSLSRIVVSEPRGKKPVTRTVTTKVEIPSDVLPSMDKKVAEALMLGRRLFHRPVAFDGRACASCHPDGRTDGLTWASPAGGLQTPMLAGRIEGTEPYGWLGDGATLHAHIKETLVRLKAQKLDAAGMNALATYVTNAKTFLSRRPTSQLEVRGKEIFASDAAGCRTCHQDAGKKGDGQKRDVGTGLSLDTPSLRFVGGTPPYMHDGRYATLREVIVRTDGKMGHTSHLAEADVQALLAYLKTLH